MNVTARRPNESLCLPSLLLENHPGQFCFFSLFLWGAGGWLFGNVGTLAKAHYMCFCFYHVPAALTYTPVWKKKHPRHTNWLMSRSISCCMKLKMASGRRSIVYLLRGHASAFLCHSKKKNIYCNAASSSVKWTPMEFTSSDSQQQTNKHSNNVISPNETHFKQCSVRKLISNPYAQCIWCLLMWDWGRRASVCITQPNKHCLTMQIKVAAQTGLPS